MPTVICAYVAALSKKITKHICKHLFFEQSSEARRLSLEVCKAAEPVYHYHSLIEVCLEPGFLVGKLVTSGERELFKSFKFYC